MSSEAKMPIDIIPALLVKSREELMALASRVEPFAETVQLDVVDGVFDDDLSWPYASPGVLEDFSDFRLPYPEKIFWEADLMVKDPRGIGLALVHAGASRVIAHVEAFSNADEARSVFEEWQKEGAQAGVSLLLQTPPSAIDDIFHDVQMIQVMGIAEIGAQGHRFDERAGARVSELRARYPEVVIAVDGGVTVEHAAALAHAGANRLVVGSAIIKSDNPKAAYEELCRIVETT